MACSSLSTATFRSPSIWAYLAALTRAATSSVMAGITSSGFSDGSAGWEETASALPAGEAETAEGVSSGSARSAARSISSTERGLTTEFGGSEIAAGPSSAASSPVPAETGGGATTTGCGTGTCTTFSTTTVLPDRLKETPTISRSTKAIPPNVQQATPNARSRPFFALGEILLIHQDPYWHQRSSLARKLLPPPELLHNQSPLPGSAPAGPS